MTKEFSPNYIKCSNCKNILDLSFVSKKCPNPLCGFDFTGLDEYMEKSDYELFEALRKADKDKDKTKGKLIKTAIKYNIGNYLAHFIECNWSAHYNTLFNTFIKYYFDDVEMLKKILKSDYIKEKDNVIVSKNDYKIFPDLYQRLIKVNSMYIPLFLKKEFRGIFKKVS